MRDPPRPLLVDGDDRVVEPAGLADEVSWEVVGGNARRRQGPAVP